MGNFKEFHLKELYDELVMGQSPNSETYNDEGKGLPFVQGNADMNDGFPKIRMYTTDPKKLSQKGDLLLSVRAPVGDLFQNNIGEMAIGRGLSAIRIHDQHLNRYIYYYFSWDKRQFLKLEQGTTFTEIGKREVRNLKVLLPENSNEQSAIATILSQVDKAIEAAKTSISAAEKFKKALMQNLLSGRLKPDGSQRKDNEFSFDEKYGRVPIGWKIKAIKECFDFFPTSSYSRSQLLESGEIGYIHYGDIHTKFDRILNVDEELLPFIPNELQKNYKLLKDGDMVISDASEDWDGVGKSVELINVGDKKIIAGLHTLHLRPKSDDFIQGIKGYILSIYKVAINIRRLATGMKVYGISKPNLGRVLLPIPTKPEQLQIKEKLDYCSNIIIQKQNKIHTLNRLKKSLMQNLLTGKVRIDVEAINKIIGEN